MKSSKKDTIINAGFGVALAILVVIGFLYYWNETAMTEFDQMEERSYQVIVELEGLVSAMKDVEIGELAFILTGKEEVLEPYRVALGRIERHLATLKDLTRSHPTHQNRVSRIETLVRPKLAEVADTIDVRKKKGFRAAYRQEFTDRHERLMDEIRWQLTEARQAIGGHLNRRKAMKEASSRNMINAFFAGTSLSFALLMTIFILLRRDITDRKRAEGKFRGLLEAAPEAVVIVNDKGEICIVNSQAEELFGYERGELYGQKVEMLVPERFRKSHASHRKGYFLNPRVRRMGTATELFGLRKDGREFLADISLSPLNTDEGVLVITTLRDITESRRMEEILRFSEARYRALFRDNPTMIVTLDSDLTMLTVNPICAFQLGYLIDELEGQSVLKLFREADRPAVAGQLRQCLQTPGHVYHWQFRKVHKDGSLLWVEETAQAVYDQGGRLNLLVVCQDITERRRMEDELRKSGMQNELILSSAGEGIIGLDLEGNHTFVNASAAAMLGYEVDELVGHHSHSMWHYAKPDGSTYLVEECPVYAAYKDGTVHSGEEMFWRKDGTGFLAEYTSRPIVSDGKIAGAVITFNDITERKRIEEALQESEERFRATFDQSAMGISHVGPDGHMLRVNRKYCDIVGYSEEELKSLNIQDITHPDDREKSVKHFQQMLEGKLKSYSLEKRYIRKDGSIVWVNLTVSTVVDSGGNLRFGASVAEDITIRKQAEEEIERLNTRLAARAAELESANVELEAFNYTVAHDLRNPLNVISSYCQVIMEMCGVKLDEQCRRYLQESYDGTLRMNRLIEALLQFSRLAHVELHSDRVDLSSMAKEVAAELRTTEAARRVEFRITEGIIADGDASLLRVVLMNLLGNAWKYTAKQEEGIIEFGAKEINEKPAYFVKDNGAGFDNATAEKIFAPFQRLPGAEECRGFGIGLATVERIIRRHGGGVCAEGEPGKGATFYFTLPQ
jgi:PAS domain S-box-containing protein